LVFHRLPGVPLASLLSQRQVGDGGQAVGAAPTSGLLAVLETRR
jgi:hypothetical protein